MWKKKLFAAIAASLVITFGASVVVFTQSISKIAGLAVAQSATRWNNVRDGAAGDALAFGVLASGLYAYNGVTFDRVRGTTANGLDVDVTRIQGGTTPADNFANPTDILNTFALIGGFDGSTWDRIRTLAPGDGTANPGTGAVAVSNFPHLWDTADWNRWFSANGVAFTGHSGEGVAVTQPSISDRGGTTDRWIGENGRGAVVPTQTQNDNEHTTGTNTALAHSLGATANRRGMIHKMAARCSAGTSELRIESPNGTILWQVPIATTYVEVDFPAAFQSAVNTEIRVELDACGAGNDGFLMSQKSLF